MAWALGTRHLLVLIDWGRIRGSVLLGDVRFLGRRVGRGRGTLRQRRHCSSPLSAEVVGKKEGLARNECAAECSQDRKSRRSGKILRRREEKRSRTDRAAIAFGLDSVPIPVAKVRSCAYAAGLCIVGNVHFHGGYNSHNTALETGAAVNVRNVFYGSADSRRKNSHFRFLLRASARLNSLATLVGGHLPLAGFHPCAQAAMNRACFAVLEGITRSPRQGLAG